ncbi:hypothetical protein PR048_006423, partial [Dryococelus australis]
MLTEFGVENLRKKKSVGFLADGIPVNFGHIHDVPAGLKKLCPWLLAIHCLSHRLKLSEKCYIHSIQEVLVTFTVSRATSLSRVTLVPTSRVQGVRWISHKKKCLNVLSGNWATGNNSHAAKLSGIVKTIKSAKFVAWVFTTDGHFGDALSELLKPNAKMEEDGSLTKQGIYLSHCSSIDTFKDKYNDILTQLLDLVHKRFSDLHENDFVKFGIKILHDKMRLTDEENLCIYGNEEINFLCTNCKEVLEEKCITADGVCEEWKYFKTFWLSNLRHTIVCKNYKKLPNFVHIICILRHFPVSISKVEIKKNFSSKKATENCLTKKPCHPDTTPYGPRPCTSKANN